MLSLLLALPLADSAEEGRNIILGMLITGLIFVSVIAVGETSKYLRHRREARRPPAY